MSFTFSYLSNAYRSSYFQICIADTLLSWSHLKKYAGCADGISLGFPFASCANIPQTPLFTSASKTTHARSRTQLTAYLPSVYNAHKTSIAAY